MTKLRAFAGAASCALAVLYAGQAQAQSSQAAANNCMPIAKVLQEIAGPKYNEVPIFTGIAKGPNGQPVAVMGFANVETGTFTVLIRPNADLACPVMDGAEFELHEKRHQEAPKPGQGT